MVEDALPTVIAVLAACTVVNLIAAVYLARRSLPQALENRLLITEAMCGEHGAEMYKLRAEAGVWRAEAEGFRDEAGEFFKRSESKAARVRAAESKQARMAEPPPTTRDEIVNAGRRIRLAQGL